MLEAESDVRPARVADIPSIVAVWHSMRLEAGLPDKELVHDWRTLLTDLIAQHITGGSAVVWLSERGGTLAGTALALLKDDYPYCLFQPSMYGFIGCVYTAPEFRGRGIATDLVERSADWLRTRGVTRVRLLPTNASRAIYQRIGFRPVQDLELLL